MTLDRCPIGCPVALRWQLEKPCKRAAASNEMPANHSLLVRSPLRPSSSGYRSVKSPRCLADDLDRRGEAFSCPLVAPFARSLCSNPFVFPSLPHPSHLPANDGGRPARFALSSGGGA